MKNEEIMKVLMQDYQHTVVLYPFEDRIFFAENNLRSSLSTISVGSRHGFTAKCIINQGNLRYCSWNKNNKRKASHNGEQATLEGDIYINNFMSEIHRIYKKAEENINNNDILILRAFSLALASAVAQGITKKANHDRKPWLLRERKRNTHYIFIVPTEWEHGIKENIILPIFKQAGLVDEKDQSCKLLFYTELDTMLERLRDEQKLELERGREYVLWKFDPTNGNTLSMAYDCFEASDSRANNKRGESRKTRGADIRNPVSVYSSNKVYLLTYIDTIRQSVSTFLKDKKIIAVFPPTADMKEEKVMVVIDMLIAAVLTCYSKKLENKEDLSKMSEVYPFEDLDLSDYNSILNSEELLKSTDMFEVHKIMFRDNEAVIEEVLNDIVTINDDSRSSNDRRRIILAYNEYRERITREIDLPAKFNEDSTSHWAKELGIGTKSFAETDETQIRIELSKIYIYWIYCFILIRFENDANYQALFDPANLPFRFKYSTSLISSLAAFKFKHSTAVLITRLPPLLLSLPLLSLPCSYKKNGVLQDTQFKKKSNPEYIVKIDINFFEPSTFACFQLDYGKKCSVKAISTTNKCTDSNHMSLPVLSNYFTPKSTDGSCYPERVYITARLLEIINTHFEYALDYFSKYDRQTSKNKRLFTVKEEELDSWNKSILDEHNECLLFRSFDNLIPEIKLELEKSDKGAIKLLMEISHQCCIKVLLMIYLGVLKYNISAFLEEKIGKKGDAAGENTTICYTILVDAFFFHTYLKESHSSLIELAIASGFAKDEEDCKTNVRVITDREEQLLPILEQKIGTNLPLKSFYVHGRLYERYLHITLNQVVIQGLLPDQNSKNIVIESKVITIPYLLDMICDNLWDTAQNYNCIIPDANCKQHNEDHASLQEFSLIELEGFKDKMLSGAKKLLFTDSISELVGISIPISNACDCRLYFGSEDIFGLGIIPAIKYTVSVLTGAITNEDIFGMYGIKHFFVAFDYFTSVFHHSYQKYFEYSLKRLIDTNLEKKRLKIPYTVFPEPIGGLLQPVINESCILADSFLYGNILQVFGETYSLGLHNINTMYKRVFEAGGYKMLEEEKTITIVEKGEIVPRTGVIKKVLYVRNEFFDEEDDTNNSLYFASVDVTQRNSSNNNINNALEQPESLLEEYIIDDWLISSDRIFSRNKTHFDQHSYFPLYVAVKYFSHSSSVTLSIRARTGFAYNKKPNDEHTYSILTERLTVINTT